MKRRHFLKGMAGATLVSALPSFLGCSEEAEVDAFPQGIASGDPRPDGVLLWTRVESTSGSERVTWVIATDDRFSRVVAEGSTEALEAADHTVRVRVNGLAPGTTYFYRFHARGVDSPIGRTKTAPDPSSDVPVRIAVASCQDFVGRHFHAWRWLAEHADDIDFVLFLGDYIYEYTTGTDVAFAQGGHGERRVELPDGFTVIVDGSETRAAQTLRDYRALYKQYKRDPHLQRVHALFPFVAIWDDHEFANDAWQDHATDFNEAQGPEEQPERRHSATRAWIEYLPVDLAFDERATPPLDTRTFRAVRWGKHVEIALTDGRAYRSDHVIAEGPADRDVGKILPNSPLGSRIVARKSVFDERERVANPTMLGDEQKRWLCDALCRSSATWRVWASSTVVSPMVLDLRPYDRIPEAFRDIVYFKLDQWDGYRSERKRILDELAKTQNLVVLSGDIHAFYASTLLADFDGGKSPIGVELTTAGISSAPVQEQVRTLVEASPVLRALGLSSLVDEFDRNLLQASPHFAYANSAAHGIMIVEVDRDRALHASMVHIDDVKTGDYREPTRIERFSVASGSAKLVREG